MCVISPSEQPPWLDDVISLHDGSEQDEISHANQSIIHNKTGY